VRKSQRGQSRDPQYKSDPDPEAWCDATFVVVNVNNRSYFRLSFTIKCEAFGSFGKLLSTGTTDDRYQGERVTSPGVVGPLDRNLAFLRLDKVDYAAVARVECHAENVRK